MNPMSDERLAEIEAAYALAVDPVRSGSVGWELYDGDGPDDGPAHMGELIAEVRRLREEIEVYERDEGDALDAAAKWADRLGRPLTKANWFVLTTASPAWVVADDVAAAAVAEVERLKRGEFTPEEFQNLCHNLPASCGRQAFEAGCREYQAKLFGPPPTLPPPYPPAGGG